MISASKLHFEESKCISELHFFGLLHRVSFKGQPQKCAEQKVDWDVQTFVNSLGSVDVQDNTSRLLPQNMKAACPSSQIGSHNIIRNQQSLFSFLLSGLDLEHVLYNQTKENNIVSTIKLCDPATIRSKFSSYWHFWHKNASIDGTINISRPSISLDYKSEKKQILVQISKKTKTNFSHEITSGSSSSIPLAIDYTRRGTSSEGYVLFLSFLSIIYSPLTTQSQHVSAWNM